MIARLYGTIHHVDDRRALIDCNGTGYEVIIGPSCRSGKCHLHLPGELFILHQVTEKSQTLYGFPTLAERDLAVDIVNEVAGVGPVIAHRFVTSAGYDAIAKAVMTGDTGVIPKVKGIGAGKVNEIVTALRKTGKVSDALDPRVAKVIAALRAIGHDHPDITSIVGEIARRQPNLDTGSITKLAIQQMKA